jgi:sugar phosphate isomerase/epimerase
MLRHVALVLVALAAGAAPAAATPAPGTYGARLGAHSMIYLNTPPAQQRAMFRAAADAGVQAVRMDFAIGQVFPRDGKDFTAVDRVDALAAEYGVDVLGVITTTPWYMGACPDGRNQYAERCAPAPRYERRWRRMVAQVARRAGNVCCWELGNEPDGYGFYAGVREYARWADLAAQGIRAVRPDATIVLGGLAHLNETFAAQALHDPSHPLAGVIDVANVHLRGTLGSLQPSVAAARALFHAHGFDGPLWITETGYPSSPDHQWDPGFVGGPRAQARWLARGLRTLVDAGAQRVFVTFRDTREFGRASPFASEGILRWPQLDRRGRARPKPAFWAVWRLAARPCRC